MKSHVAEIVLSITFAGVICYAVLAVLVNAIEIDAWICCSIMLTTVVATAASHLRRYAEEDKQEILEEIKKLQEKE